MALSDCEKCWGTPCTCGWEFRNYTSERLADFIASTLNHKDQETAAQILEQAKLKMIDNHKNQ